MDIHIAVCTPFLLYYEEYLSNSDKKAYLYYKSYPHPNRTKWACRPNSSFTDSSFDWYLELCDFLFFHLKSSSRDFCSGKSSNLSSILFEVFHTGTDPDSCAVLWIVTLSYKSNHTHHWREGKSMLQHTETWVAVSLCTDPAVGAMRNWWKLSLHSLCLLVNCKKKV